jgi:hypothetical protein
MPRNFLEAHAVFVKVFTRRFFAAGEQRPDHNRAATHRESLRDVADVGDAAVGDHGNLVLRRHLRGVVDRGGLRAAASHRVLCDTD